MSDREIETLIGKAAAKTRRRAWNRSSRVVKENLTTENLEGQARFMVDEDGNQLFNIENVGKLSLENLLKNNSVTKHTKVLTDSGNQNWGISLLKS